MRALSFQRVLNKSVGYRYLLHVPAAAEYEATKRWPVLLFLHGIGERGSSCKNRDSWVFEMLVAPGGD